jgi:hypothetical protein
MRKAVHKKIRTNNECGRGRFERGTHKFFTARGHLPCLEKIFASGGGGVSDAGVAVLHLFLIAPREHKEGLL